MGDNLQQQLEAYFPEIDAGEDDFSLSKYRSVYISIFDHWLTEIEADNCNVLCYRIALDSNRLDEYKEGERKFLNFYQSLSMSGVVCNRPRPIRMIDKIDSTFEEALISSLREEKSMDVYFLSCRARIIGRYDRTDLALLGNDTDLVEFENKIREAGLFVLRSQTT